MMTEQDVNRNRLLYLEHTVQQLNGRLREMQGELRQVKVRSTTTRWWSTWMGAKPEDLYMSAVCDRRIRPNRKVNDDDRRKPAA